MSSGTNYAVATRVAEAKRPHSVSVLVIDDDLDVRLTLEEILTDEGYSVMTASNGKDALERLKSITPSLILLDLTMPVMNGMQFRGVQLEDPTFAAIPTVVMTADGQAHEKFALLRAEECLTKPLDIEQLFQLVARYCKRN